MGAVAPGEERAECDRPPTRPPPARFPAPLSALQVLMQRFNTDPKLFVFILSTRRWALRPFISCVPHLPFSPYFSSSSCNSMLGLSVSSWP